MNCRTVSVAANLSTPILVVEDFSTMVRILRNLLKQIGLENVDDAADGRIALAKMREKSYELVITDCNMAAMSGYELLREIRTDPRLELTAILMMTADPNIARLVKETDITQYLIKPFSAETLKVKIDGLLAHRSPC